MFSQTLSLWAFIRLWWRWLRPAPTPPQEWGSHGVRVSSIQQDQLHFSLFFIFRISCKFLLEKELSYLRKKVWSPPPITCFLKQLLFIYLFIYLSLPVDMFIDFTDGGMWEREREKEKHCERETSTSVTLLHPDWGLNSQAKYELWGPNPQPFGVWGSVPAN